MPSLGTEARIELGPVPEQLQRDHNNTDVHDTRAKASDKPAEEAPQSVRRRLGSRENNIKDLQKRLDTSEDQTRRIFQGVSPGNANMSRSVITVSASELPAPVEALGPL